MPYPAEFKSKRNCSETETNVGYAGCWAQGQSPNLAPLCCESPPLGLRYSTLTSPKFLQSLPQLNYKKLRSDQSTSTTVMQEEILGKGIGR